MKRLRKKEIGEGSEVERRDRSREGGRNERVETYLPGSWLMLQWKYPPGFSSSSPADDHAAFSTLTPVRGSTAWTASPTGLSSPLLSHPQ